MCLLKERQKLHGLPKDSPFQGKMTQQMYEEALLSVNQAEPSYGLVSLCVHPASLCQFSTPLGLRRWATPAALALSWPSTMRMESLMHKAHHNRRCWLTRSHEFQKPWE